MFLGIDIGGHGIKGGLVEDYLIKNTTTCKLSGNESIELFMQKVDEVICSLKTESLQAIGIGVPGIVDPEKGIIYDIQNIPSLTKVHLKKALETEFQIPVFINNDSNCFALGESIFGYGRNYNNFLGLTLGTGMGTGIIINKKLYSGVFCGAGEFGMLPYKDGILEHYTGSFFFEKNNTTGTIAYHQALQNVPEALAIFNSYGRHLGNAISMMLHALAPEAIILGGSISKAFPFFAPEFYKTIDSFPFKKQIENFRIHISEGSHMGILGAAALGMPS